MAKPTDELRGHHFDGIQEYDNPLPTWWLWLFYLTIAFAAVYIPYIHNAEGALLVDEYQAEMSAAEAKYGSMKIEWNAAELATHCETDAWKAPADADFKTNCVACHRADGGGLVGPALTDDSYLHGGRLADIANTITVGVPAKGMIAWSKVLKQDQIRDLTCYVHSLRGTKVANPKAPEGTKVDADGAPVP